MLRVREAKEGVVHISLKNQNFNNRNFTPDPPYYPYFMIYRSRALLFICL